MNRHGLREADIYVSRETYMPAFFATQKKFFLINKKEENSYTQKEEELSALIFSFRKNQKTNGERVPLMIFHERSRFAVCQWELSTPTDISIPSTA